MKDRTIFLLLGIAGVILGIYVWTQLEYYEEEVDVGWSVAAFLNPYLAAEQFLQKIGLEVDSSYHLDLTDDIATDATLFIGDANDVLDQRRADKLIEWMVAGGHVIVAAQLLTENVDDVFLSRFGVEKYSDQFDIDLFPDGEEIADEEEEKSLGDRLREANELMQEEQAKLKQRERLEEEGKLRTTAENVAFDESQYTDSDIMALDFDGVDAEFQVLVDREEYLDHPSFYLDDDEEYDDYRPFYWQGTDAGIGFMQFEVENGLLTVIGDGTIWTNERIGLFDHALLLRLLTSNAGKVVFLRGAVVPNLLQLTWRNFRELCTMLVLILVLWLVYRSRRFGAIVDTSDFGRRSFREHLSAVGDFFWRYKHRDDLLDHARDAVWRAFNKKYFSARNDSENDKIKKIAELTNKAPTYVHSLMLGAAPQDEFKFYQRVKSLQQLRKQL